MAGFLLSAIRVDRNNQFIHARECAYDSFIDNAITKGGHAMNIYNIIGSWLSFWGIWSWQDDWRCACDIVPLPGNGGIAGIPARFAGC